jgi:diamine N-acetyltransferase
MLTSCRGISIRQVVADDLPFVFRLYTDPARNHLWTQCRRVFDEFTFREAWTTWMNNVFAARFLVESGQQPVGLVVAYEHFPEHGYAKIGAMLGAECVGHGGGVVATALLTDYLFATLPLRKVYLESYGFNPAVVRMLRKLGLPEEGCLKESYYWDGAYWDLHIFAVYRDAWPGLRVRVLSGEQRGAGHRLALPSRNGNLAHAIGRGDASASS